MIRLATAMRFPSCWARFEALSAAPLRTAPRSAGEGRRRAAATHGTRIPSLPPPRARTIVRRSATARIVAAALGAVPPPPARSVTAARGTPAGGGGGEEAGHGAARAGDSPATPRGTFGIVPVTSPHGSSRRRGGGGVAHLCCGRRAPPRAPAGSYDGSREVWSRGALRLGAAPFWERGERCVWLRACERASALRSRPGPRGSGAEGAGRRARGGPAAGAGSRPPGGGRRRRRRRRRGGAGAVLP